MKIGTLSDPVTLSIPNADGSPADPNAGALGKVANLRGSYSPSLHEVKIEWDEVPTATAYVLEYQAPGTSIWQVFSTQPLNIWTGNIPGNGVPFENGKIYLIRCHATAPD